MIGIILVLQSSRCERKSWLQNFNCVLAVVFVSLSHSVLVGLWSVIVSFSDHTL